MTPMAHAIAVGRGERMRVIRAAVSSDEEKMSRLAAIMRARPGYEDARVVTVPDLDPRIAPNDAS